jgi:hypothetical protein
MQLLQLYFKVDSSASVLGNLIDFSIFILYKVLKITAGIPVVDQNRNKNEFKTDIDICFTISLEIR